MNFVISTILLIASSITILTAQDKNHNTAERFNKRNAIFIEGGGLARMGSINYERIIVQNGLEKIALRIGYGFFPTMVDFFGVKETYKNSVIPIEFSAFTGKSNHTFEGGFGISPTFEKEPVFTNYFYSGNTSTIETRSYFYPSVNARAGYRYQRQEGGLYFRASFIPMLFPRYRGAKWKLTPWGGINVGFSF